MKRAKSIFLACLVSTVAYGGAQQDFFATRAKGATRVRIVKIGPDKTISGVLVQHMLLDARGGKEVGKVAAMIELLDPLPEKRGAEEEVWTGSGLTFGMAKYQIDFLKDDRVLLSYGTDAALMSLTPFGDHAPQGTDLMLDYPLSKRSAKHLSKLVRDLMKRPNQSPEPTVMSVTPPAAQEPRQP